MNIKYINNLSFFDGETVKDKYVLLGNETKHIFNKSGLTAKECLDFLFTESKAFNYFFRIDYDLNMIFSKVELTDKVLEIFKGEDIKFEGYEITYYRHKILRLVKKVNGKKRIKKFYDISNFFHASFLKTLDILEIQVQKNHLDFLKKYKLLRSSFKAKDIENIIKYNQLECIYGLRIAVKINSLLPQNLKTWALYGSSGIAHIYLLQKDFDKINFIFRDIINNEQFESAYFGGRMEAFKVGKVGNSYKYDINSAYPNIIKNLREVINIEIKDWKLETRNRKIIETNLYLIKLDIADVNLIGLLPFRLKCGYLVFPKNVSGYYYGYEIKVIQEYIKQGYSIDLEISQEIKIHLGNKIFENEDINEIKEFYELRKELKAKGDLRNYIYKILLNSIYGKTAQQTGTHKFLSFYYAGLITSGTRAALLKAVINNPYDVVFFATDGILTLSKLDLDIGYNLGQWEEIEIKTGYVIQSGVYYLTDKKNKTYQGERGFKFDFTELIKGLKKAGIYKVKENRFIGNVYFDKNYNAYKEKRCKFTVIEKTIDITNQIKRVFYFNKKVNINKLHNSEILFNVDLTELNKIEKIDFEDNYLNSEDIEKLL